MRDDIVIRRNTVYRSRREVMVAAECILRKTVFALPEADLRRGRRVRVFLNFIPRAGRQPTCGEFDVGGYPREKVSEDLIEREITGALVRGAIGA